MTLGSAARRPIFYGWIVVAVTALVVLVSAGVRSAPGVFLVPMQHDLGMSRAVLALAASIGLVTYGAAAPLTGRLIDRFGPRFIAVAGVLVIAASMLASAAATSAWQLHLFWGFLSGVGTGVVGSVLGATVAYRWFVTRRGLVIGILGASTSAGQLVFVPLLTRLVAEFGWRTSALLMGGLALALIVPLLAFMRNQPEDVGERALGAEARSAARALPDAGVMRRATRSLDFWLLSITFFVCGATSNGLIGTHFMAHATDHGLSAATAAGVLALMGAFNFVGTIASGWLTDRFDPRTLLCCYYGFRGASLLLLPFVHDPVGLSFFAILFGLDYIATVPPTTALVADTFGRGNVGTVYGWVFCAHQIGAALAAWLGGVARDALGDYGPAFLVAGATAVAGGLLALGVQRWTPRPAPEPTT